MLCIPVQSTKQRCYLCARPVHGSVTAAALRNSSEYTSLICISYCVSSLKSSRRDAFYRACFPQLPPGHLRARRYFDRDKRGRQAGSQSDRSHRCPQWLLTVANQTPFRFGLILLAETTDTIDLSLLHTCRKEIDSRHHLPPVPATRTRSHHSTTAHTARIHHSTNYFNMDSKFRACPFVLCSWEKGPHHPIMTRAVLEVGARCTRCPGHAC